MADSGFALTDWSSLIGGVEGLERQEIATGVWRLTETVIAAAHRSFFYLLEGEDRDCLIDGGWGFCTSLDPLRRDPAKPLIAIASHSHVDHVGLLHLAGRRFGHAAEAAVFADPTPWATQALPYLDDLSVLSDGGRIAPASIRQAPCPLDGFVGEGDSIDLGGRSLRVFHTPGHSPGSLSLLDERDGLLFSADTVHDGYIFDEIPGADREALLLSHRRLERVEFAKACPGHGAILDRPAFLGRIERYRRDYGG